MVKNYKGWRGVEQFAREQGLDWIDVCNLIWLHKNKKRPSYLWILICARIYQTMQQIRGKNQIKIEEQVFLRNVKETDIHFAIRIHEKWIKKNYTIKALWKTKPDFYKSVRQKYLKTFKKYSKTIKTQRFDI